MGGLESPNQCGKSTLPSPSCFATRRPFHIKRWFPCSKFTVVGQYGTHIDAPIHFVEGGRWLDEIDLKDLPLATFMLSTSLKKLLPIQTLS